MRSKLSVIAFLFVVACKDEPAPAPAPRQASQPVAVVDKPASAPAAPATVTSGPRVVAVEGEATVKMQHTGVTIKGEEAKAKGKPEKKPLNHTKAEAMELEKLAKATE